MQESCSWLEAARKLNPPILAIHQRLPPHQPLVSGPEHHTHCKKRLGAGQPAHRQVEHVTRQQGGQVQAQPARQRQVHAHAEQPGRGEQQQQECQQREGHHGAHSTQDVTQMGQRAVRWAVSVVGPPVEGGGRRGRGAVPWTPSRRRRRGRRSRGEVPGSAFCRRMSVIRRRRCCGWFLRRSTCRRRTAREQPQRLQQAVQGSGRRRSCSRTLLVLVGGVLPVGQLVHIGIHSVCCWRAWRSLAHTLLMFAKWSWSLKRTKLVNCNWDCSCFDSRGRNGTLLYPNKEYFGNSCFYVIWTLMQGIYFILRLSPLSLAQICSCYSLIGSFLLLHQAARAEGNRGDRE